MKFLMAQVNPIVGAIAHNTALITDMWKQYKDDADLIVFPELVLSGYPPEDLVLKPAFQDWIERAVVELCALNVDGGAAMVVSTPWRINERMHSAILLIDQGKICAVIPKHHLPNYSVFDEPRVFHAGPLPKAIDFRGTKIGLMTCEDMWFADVAGELKSSGAEILVIPNGSPYEVEKNNIRTELARKRAIETGLPLLYVNQVGGQDELVFDGCSFCMNADGDISGALKAFEKDSAIVTLQDNSLSCGHHADWPVHEESIFRALTLGLRDYIQKNHFPGVVLGLSGGIDSALAAVLSVEAIGADKVSCIMMPSPYTSQISLDDAQSLSNNLGCTYDIISIDDGMKTFDTMLGGDARKGVTSENIQSRIRGMILMAKSNASGAMVVSTGNKSEMAVGYATLYGDMCGGYAVLKDLYKEQVYALCRWVNENAGRDIIPDRIITRPPSAELKPDQCDQDSLPPYAVLDDILEGLIEYELRRIDLIERGHDPDVVQRVWAMLDRAEYKRRQAAPGVKLTSRAFGRDRRYPITNHFQPPLEEEHHDADAQRLEKHQKTV